MSVVYDDVPPSIGVGAHSVADRRSVVPPRARAWAKPKAAMVWQIVSKPRQWLSRPQPLGHTCKHTTPGVVRPPRAACTAHRCAG